MLHKLYYMKERGNYTKGYLNINIEQKKMSSGCVQTFFKTHLAVSKIYDL